MHIPATHLVDVVAGNDHKWWDVCGRTAGQACTLQGGCTEVEHLNLATDASKHCSTSRKYNQAVHAFGTGMQHSAACIESDAEVEVLPRQSTVEVEL
jgi:hypothetical protein